jgi:hypothetical protein
MKGPQAICSLNAPSASRSASSWRPCASSWRLWQALAAIKLCHPWAADQAQQPLEFAAVACAGVELEGKSASIKSSSECIQSSNAISFSSCFVLCSERSICISLAGSRRQLSIRKNERKGGSDEPDAPLLLERELAVGEVDVDIGRKQSNQANNTANDGFQQGFAVKTQAPQGR